MLQWKPQVLKSSTECTDLTQETDHQQYFRCVKAPCGTAAEDETTHVNIWTWLWKSSEQDTNL